MNARSKITIVLQATKEPASPVGRAQLAVFESKMFGSAQQHINKEIVQQTLILVPQPQIADVFKNIVSPIYEKIRLALLHIQNLRRTRDLLLPRLLSGSINLSEEQQ